MLNPSSLTYCNCASVPFMPCSTVFPSWNCPVPTPNLGYGTSLDGMATHGALGFEQRDSSTEPSKSRRLKFGIENILHGKTSHPEHQEFRFPDFPFLWNEGLNFITHQPFYTPPMRTSTRPWCRPVFTQLQRRGLEKRFQATKYVTKRERLQIGAMLGLSETQVKVWFQNRRTKWRHEAAKKEKKEEKQLKEQSSAKTNNCVQKEELKEEKEEEEE
ncbi:unnamed protein product [Porites lobata]|uniref:Homeobox domain-containing protein n=1 Tax=Porites lobata TaxID=104759 RepID=A0ABN8NUB4_9CNID|nr:unnamed protein product [Porites lobata]